MPNNFKLRLGDGTELVVDHDGLRTWAVDEKATVQTKKGWRSLRDVLAHLDRPPKPDDGEPVIGLKKLEGETRRAQVPPPATGELKTLSFADSGEDEPPAEEDEYLYEGPTVLGTAWLWMKRAVVLAVLGVGGYFAAMTWQTWLPKAGEFGVAVVGLIERQTGARSSSSAAPSDGPQVREAVETAAQQLPHLSPEAIHLVMTSSLSGVLEPPEVFRRAQEAAERGASSLTPAETQELKTLRAAVLAAMPPVERERVREYEKARGYRATLAFEDRAALGSYAQAARALPAASRDRLRALLGKAITAALRSAPGSDDAAARAVAAR